MNTAKLAADRNEIAAAIGLLINPGDVFELRIPKAGRFKTISGYFNNADALVKSLQGFPLEQFSGIYVTLNPLTPALMARANNRAVPYAESTATDKDVTRRRWFPLDFDAVRPAGISSSAEEHEAAHMLALHVRDVLGARGWPEPIYADSGNGAHLLYPVELPNDEETRAIMQAALESLSAELSTEQIKIDRSVFNASRIWKLYGTVGRKGEDMPDRPHRISRVIHVPAVLNILDRETIAASIAKPEPASAPQRQPQAAQPYSGDRFDLDAWISRHGIEARGPLSHNGGQKWILRTCPFNAEHNRGEAMLGTAPSGGIFFKCQHNSCRHHTWADVREMFEGPRQRPAPTPAPAPAGPPVNDNVSTLSEPFRLLGHDHPHYYVYQREKNQIITMTKADFTENGLLELAPATWWAVHFPKKNSNFDKAAATDWLMRSAADAGIYDPSLTRGRGAWMDEGRTVFHFGSHLWVDGRTIPVSAIESKYVYQLNRRLPAPGGSPLSDAEGRNIVEISKMFRWTKPASAALLSGWVALAPLCGALRWRPHIWITGGAGCGKTTVLNEYVHLLMGGMDIFAQGNSTEAGIRQTLRSDALPVLFDESEQNNDREASRVQNVLSLIRQASSESAAVTLKGTAGGEAMHFHIRSMFCLSSIQVGMKHQADFERLTVLALRPKREDVDAAATWEELRDRLYMLRRDETTPARLLRRSMDLLPITLQNIKTFVDAAARKFGNVREGDQYGTLMAGCWSLMHGVKATTEQAAELLDTFDWSEHRESIEVDESSRALGVLMESQIRTAGGVSATVWEIVQVSQCNPRNGLEITPRDADALLQRFGMRVVGRDLLLSNNSHALVELLDGTPYAADWRGQLLRVNGARRYERTQRFNGIPSKCIAVPLAILEDDRQDDDPPY